MMKLTGFSFKSEAVWILIFGLGIPLLGFLIYLIVLLFRPFIP
jgi:hypothetical protein